MNYDVFISYSHGGDDLLSERVQEGLTKFAKPWYRRRALNVFRDRTALSANPGLWSSIAEAIDNSRYFLALASPDAAASVWCGREVEHWRSKHGSEGLLVLLTDGEILWDEGTNDFNWAATTALGAAFAGAFAEEPFHVDMRWARSETQLDLTDGRFRDQIADLAAPVHGMAKDELTGEDVRQHRRALRQAVAAGIALVLLTVAAVATSIFAVNAAARARTEQHNADVQRGLALIASHQATEASHRATKAKLLAQTRQAEAIAAKALAVKRRREAELSAIEAAQQKQLAENRAADLAVANTNLIEGSLALRQSTLLAEARLAARRSEQLMSSGDQTYQLGAVLAAEAVRHACASAAIVPTSTSAQSQYPDPGCAQPGIQIEGSVTNSALGALSNAGGAFVTARLAGSVSTYPMVWSSNSQSFTTYSAAQANRPDSVQVWNTDGSLAATASSAAGLTPEVALSGDGNTLAMTGNVPGGAGNVSAWSLASQQPAPVGDPPGRHPALSGNGGVMAWLEPFGAKAIDISTGPGQRRRVVVPFVPVGVAVSADGSLVAALVDRYGDSYSIVPIDVATGKVGAARDVGNFPATSLNPWSNPPRTVPTQSADPPAVSFDPSGSTVWVSNNQYHVGVELARTASAPTAQVRYHRQITTQLSGGDLSGLRTTTPDGHTAVFYNGNNATYQVFIWSSGWKTAGVVPIQLCSANPCNFSISPDGSELAVASVSALQIIDIRSPASTSSAIIGSQGPIPSGSSVVMGPAGGTALSWSAGSLALIDEATGMERQLAVPLGAGENFDAVGFNPGGSRAIAVIGRGDGCPCRVVTLDAVTGNVLSSAALGSSALSRIPHDTPVAVTLNDGADIAAVTYDTNAHGSSGPHRCALATYSLVGGQPLQVIANASIGLGEHDVSVPAFQPGTDAVSLVATQGSSHEVAGVVLDARSGATLHTLSMSSGAVTLYPDDYGNDGYALRFSPNGQLLAWNTEGSVVIWDLSAAAGSQNVQTDVVLTSASSFDPTALAISDNGEVATVGLNFYTSIAQQGTDVVMTGDELGRSLQPLGIARIAATGQPEGQISVAMPGAGQIAAVALDMSGSRFFTDTWDATPATLLAELCSASSRAITPGEWQTYFPGEPYDPACSQNQAATSWSINAAPPPVSAATVSLRAHPARRAASVHPARRNAPVHRARSVTVRLAKPVHPQGSVVLRGRPVSHVVAGKRVPAGQLEGGGKR